VAVTIHHHSRRRAPLQDIERWRKIPTAIIADVSRGACLIEPAIRPLLPSGQQPRMFGFAVTAICIGSDFGAVLHALDLVQSGDVLVIAASAHFEHAMIGAILGGHLRRKGAAGILCDGAVRDVAELASWPDLPVFTRYITARGPTSAQAGEVNAVANISGFGIAAGDLIIGDDDGVVALGPEMIRTLIEPAETKLALEEKWQANLAAGKSIKETFGL
jgi:4-hydroxy-4-methyl-2-oxoglutarate aldolase